MRRSSQPGLGNLMHQPQYVYRGSRSGRYAAKFYRPIIFALTSLIVLAAWVRYLDEAALVRVSLMVGITLYAFIFVLRIRMRASHERQFYQPLIQLWRGQLSIIGVTIIIGVLEWHGLTEHGLWILYVLSTLIISEHNTTTAVSWTLLEVSVLYAATAYFSYSLHTGAWSDLATLSDFHPRLGSQILSIWLVTFVFHYLKRELKPLVKGQEMDSVRFYPLLADAAKQVQVLGNDMARSLGVIAIV